MIATTKDTLLEIKDEYKDKMTEMPTHIEPVLHELVGYENHFKEGTPKTSMHAKLNAEVKYARQARSYYSYKKSSS